MSLRQFFVRLQPLLHVLWLRAHTADWNACGYWLLRPGPVRDGRGEHSACKSGTAAHPAVELCCRSAGRLAPAAASCRAAAGAGPAAAAAATPVTPCGLLGELCAERRRNAVRSLCRGPPPEALENPAGPTADIEARLGETRMPAGTSLLAPLALPWHQAAGTRKGASGGVTVSPAASGRASLPPSLLHSVTDAV